MGAFVELGLGMKILVIFLAILVIASLGLAGYLGYQLYTGRDDGTIGVNVTTGNVDVDIVDVDGKSLIGEVLEFVSVGGSDSNKFAPGDMIYTEGFKIKNCGSLDIDYILSISEDENVDAAEFAEAFEVWITDNPDDIGSAVDLKSFTKSLAVDEIGGTYYLVIRMRTTADNKFQNRTFTGIGVTVTAVQSGGNLS